MDKTLSVFDGHAELRLAEDNSVVVTPDGHNDLHQNINVNVYDSAEELCSALLAVSGKYLLERADEGSVAEQQAHLPDGSEVGPVVSAVPLFISGNAEKQKALGEASGFLETLVSLLRRFISIAEVAGNCCAAIKVLCRHGVDISTECLDNVNKLGELGACELVVKALEMHMENPMVVEPACWAIRNLVTIDPENNSRLVEAGGCIHSIEALRRYGTTNATASEAACGAVANMAYEDEGRDKVVELDGCKLIVDAMKVFAASNPGIARQTASAIRNLTYGDDENNKRLADEGVCEILVDILKRHCIDSSRTILTEMTSRAISNMSTEDDMSDKFGSLGACEALLDAARAHSRPESHEAIEQILAVLSTLSNTDSNKDRLNEGGACELVVSLLNQLGAAHEVLAEEGCGFIVAMAYEDAGRLRLVNAGACEAVVAMMRAHGLSSAAVGIQACSAVWNLAYQNDIDRLRLEAAGACEALTKILAAHGTTNTDLVIQASGAACNLAAADSDSSRTRFGAAGIERPVVECLKTYGKCNKAIVASIASMIVSLVYHSDSNKQRLGSVGTCEILLDILKIHISCSDNNMITQVCKAVTSLVMLPANKKKAKAYGGETILSVLRLSTSLQRDAQNDAYDALSTLQSSD